MPAPRSGAWTAALSLASAALGLAVGLAWGGSLATSPPAPSSPPPSKPASPAPAPPARAGSDAASPGDAAELRRLRAELAREREARATLARDLSDLRASLDAPADGAPVAATGGGRDAGAGGTADTGAWFDAPKLLEAGIPAHVAEELRARFERAEMQLLEIRNRAQREGWAGSPRHHRAVRRVRRELRSELGDDGYDWMLYGAGRDNRVVVSGLLERSPAARAGLERGDEILAYDGRRVFTGRSLQRSTVGSLGTVAIDVLRDGEEVRVYAPAGPLGVRLEAASRLPHTGW